MFETIIDVTIDFDERTVKKLGRDLAIKPLLACGALVEGEAKRLLSVGGRRSVGGGKTKGVPSKAPAPPHAQEGILRSSITHAATKNGTVIVGATQIAWYGKIHEFGGRNHPMRPFMVPALTASRVKFTKEFRNINLAATKAGKKLNSKKVQG